MRIVKQPASVLAASRSALLSIAALATAAVFLGPASSPASGAVVFRTVALSGTQASGTPKGANFNTFGACPVTNADGKVAFYATLSTSGGRVTTTSNEGIWSEGSGSMALVARNGSQAPGAPAGANFNSFGTPVINAGGQVAFTATLQTTGGGVTASNDAGLWAEDPSGVLTLVVREGDLFTVAPGDIRTITAINFATGSGGEDGRGITFNDDYRWCFA